MEAAVRRLYPETVRNAGYSSIIDTRHYARLIGLLEDARTRGARVVALADAPSGDAAAFAFRLTKPVITERACHAPVAGK